MRRRFRSTATTLALLALVILVFRPIALDALGVPFGAHNSPEVQFAQADGSPHCEILADCETISISNVGLDVVQMGFVFFLAGVVMAFALTRTRVLHSWTALVPNPPPLMPSLYA